MPAAGILTTSAQPAAVGALNRLLRILCRSLPMYLEDARPWTSGNHPGAEAALARLVGDQRLFAGRVAEAILQSGGQPDPGPFSGEFAGLNDTAFDYLFRTVVERLRCDIDMIRHCVVELANSPAARALAEEVLGNAQGHLELLDAVTTSDT